MGQVIPFERSQLKEDEDVISLLQELDGYFLESDDEHTLIASYATGLALVACTGSYDEAVKQLLWACHCMVFHHLDERDDKQKFAIAEVISASLLNTLICNHRGWKGFLKMIELKAEQDGYHALAANIRAGLKEESNENIRAPF